VSHLEPADLNETVGEVIELMQPRAEELGVRLEWHPGGNLARVMIDPEGIHRAVLNIVTNAIDASEDSPDARVVVRTEWDAGQSMIRISIADNGPGIDEADIPAVFQIFASTKGSSGTGLGLPVSQKIIREHGGKIVVQSRPGQGATFLLELPMSGEPDPGTVAEGLTRIE
jgi:signal transduction histidine kinase